MFCNIVPDVLLESVFLSHKKKKEVQSEKHRGDFLRPGLLLKCSEVKV